MTKPFPKQEYSQASETSTTLAATSAETETAFRTKVDTKVTQRAARSAKLVGLDHDTDVTASLPDAAPAEKTKTVSVTRVVRKEITKRPIQDTHLEGVKHFYTLHLLT